MLKRASPTKEGPNEGKKIAAPAEPRLDASAAAPSLRELLARAERLALAGEDAEATALFDDIVERAAREKAIKAAADALLEVALVSDEGMIGIPLLLGADSEPLRVLVQRSGPAWRMNAETFKRMTDTQRALREALNQYALSRLAQVEQNAICANIHRIEARLARRLLTMHDRSYSDQFAATHESLASMLGVRRSIVALVAVTFEQKNLIEYRIGTITILDRKGLETLSCECYSAARTAKAKVMTWTHAGRSDRTADRDRTGGEHG